MLTLGTGIAGAVAMFAIVQGVLLRPLPILEQDRLVVIWTHVGDAASGHWPFRAADIDLLRRESRVLESVAGVIYNGAGSFVAIESGSASYIMGAPVSGEFFDVLGVQPILGRAFTRADDVAGAEKVLVITHRLWQRRYGGARDAIGRRVIIAAQPFTIVGVMPPDVEYPRGVEAWISVAAATAMLENPAFRIDVDAIARLKPGATIEQAASELQDLTPHLEESRQPNGLRGLRPVVRSYEELVVGDVRTAMLVLFGAVGLVLLIASANVANLLLLRGEARRGELAVRAALGAGRGRLAQQLLTESVLLALAAGVVGLAVAWWSLQALVALVPAGLPRVDAVRIDAGVILFATTVAFLTAALAGVGPALSPARVDLASELRRGARGATARAPRHGRRALVVAQVALAVTVVAAAGLLTRSLLRLQSVDLGLSADRLVLVELEPRQAKYAERGRYLRFLNDVVERLEAVPAIASATPVNAAPFSGTGGWDAVFTAEGQSAERAAANPLLNLEAIHPNYFETFGVTLVRGRPFSGVDREGAPDVAIVSEDVAALAWPGEDPIGKRLKLGQFDSTDGWRTVVGVAGRTRYRELTDARPTLYLPAEQFLVTAHRLVLRTTSPLPLVAAVAREGVRAVDPTVRVMRVTPFTELLGGPLARPRFNAALIGVFGIAAVLMAAVGLYAVMAAYVHQRHAEIGIRLALGATTSNVRSLVLGEGLRLAAAGATIGLAAAFLATRLVRGLLFEVDPLDPASMVAAALLLVGVAALASYLPARRAARFDPIATLRAH